MRALLISDIHANIDALEAVLDAAPEHDVVWNLGDVVGYGAAPNEAIERVRELGGGAVTQATGIMIAGFPAAAAEHLPQLRRALEEASGSLVVLKQPAERKIDCW